MRRLTRKLFMFHKTFNNREFLGSELTANIEILDDLPICHRVWFQAMIDRLNIFHMGGIEWAGRWVVSVVS